jgi:hypothetical protein
MIVKKFSNNNSQDVSSSNFAGLVSCKNCIENSLAIGLDKDLKRGVNLISLTFIFINM